ncbi:MAG: DUF3857 domain-containing protein [Novosphingobium sp.]
MKLTSAVLAVSILALAAGQVQAQGSSPSALPAALPAPAPVAPPANAAALPPVTVAPAAAWVVPVALTAPESKGGAVVRLLDVQMRTDDKGLHTFQRSIMKFNTASALQLATNFTVEWQPGWSSATVNGLKIHRDGKVIDLLANGGKFTTIRREAQLGAFQIDGMLTAYMPVTDLRVGDELEFSFTISARNPLLAGHHEQEYFTMPGARIDQVYLSESHAKGAPVRSRWGPALPPQKTTTANGTVTTVATAVNYAPPKFQPSSPLRMLDGNALQISDFASWADVGKTMHPVFDAAARLSSGSPVQAEIDKIAAAHSDPMARADAALRLVQREVRYLAELQGLGGYQPMPADMVWERRIGDCKGKTVLLLAMLRGLGIEAEPLLVSTRRGDGTDAVLPMPGRFDHVIVHARIGGKDFWLDGTRRDASRVEDLESPDFLWGLPLSANSPGLIPIPAGEYKRPQSEWRYAFDASAGINVPAKATGTAILRGDEAQIAAQAVEVLPPDQLDEFIKTMWTGRRDGLTVTKASYKQDPDSGNFTLEFEGTAKIDWGRDGKDPKYRYQVYGSLLGTNLVADRDDPPSKDTPILVDRRSTVVAETILLPDQGKGFTLDGDDIDETIGGIRYVRKARLEGGRFEMTAITTSPRRELTLAQAQQADATSDNLFERKLYLRLPPTLLANDSGENSEALTTELEGLIGKGKIASARAMIDARLSAKPRDPELLALSGYAYFAGGDLARAGRDFDAALAINPRLPFALKGKAALLIEKNQLDDALILLDRAVLVSPEDFQLYRYRSLVRTRNGDIEGALADHAILADKFPEQQWAHWEKARMEIRAGRPAEALATARNFQKNAKDKDAALVLVIEVLVRTGDLAGARKELQAYGGGKPSELLSAIRLEYGLWQNPDQLLGDALVAVAENPSDDLPERALDALAKDPGRMAKVLAAYDGEALKPGASRERIAIAKGHAQRAAGNPAALSAALTAAETARPNDVEMHNEACWLRAIWKLDLVAARSSCEAAIKSARNGMHVDSMAMVELQGGDYPAAVRLYTEALRTLPDQPPTLFGRGLARLRSGDPGGAQDLVLARSLNPLIDEEFARYGLKP